MRKKLIELMKRSFDIFVKKKWLKEIDKAIDRYKKAQTKANRDYYVLIKLVEAYNEEYNDSLGRAAEHSEIVKFPTAEAAEMVHGEWEPHPYHPGLVRCSKCKEQIIPEDMVDEEIYCSKCGTKLGG